VFQAARERVSLSAGVAIVPEVMDMPMLTKTGQVRETELPSTIRRSSAKAQRTFAKAHDAAANEYGDGRRAHQTAYGALKHSFEKVGDHWEPKSQRGPSDEQSAKGGARSSRQYPSAEGVDANASKAHLQEIARRLDITGRSTMSKSQLVDAIKKANRRKTAARR
jgi:cation transport regulator ChaB